LVRGGTRGVEEVAAVRVAGQEDMAILGAAVDGGQGSERGRDGEKGVGWVIGDGGGCNRGKNLIHFIEDTKLKL
jgi:hypothetical protein